MVGPASSHGDESCSERRLDFGKCGRSTRPGWPHSITSVSAWSSADSPPGAALGGHAGVRRRPARPHVALSAPTKPRGSADQRHRSAPLGHEQPLWQAHVIDDVEGGGALIMRYHHCMDGTGMMVVIQRSWMQHPKRRPPRRAGSGRAARRLISPAFGKEARPERSRPPARSTSSPIHSS
jgi:hypothetical protein